MTCNRKSFLPEILLSKRWRQFFLCACGQRGRYADGFEARCQSRLRTILVCIGAKCPSQIDKNICRLRIPDPLSFLLQPLSLCTALVGNGIFTCNLLGFLVRMFFYALVWQFCSSCVPERPNAME